MTDERTPPVLTMRGYHPADPIASLPPVARNILLAAIRIIERDGFKALTYEAIGAESGEYKDSIRYYFGGKDGLIQAVFDATSHDESLRAYAEGRRHPPGAERIHSTVAASRTLSASPGNRVMWELLPHVLRSEHVRQRIADLYEVYRGHYVEVFGPVAEGGQQELVRRYATLLIAVLDGLALQKALDPERVDLDGLFDLWADIVAESADRRLAGQAAGSGSGADGGEVMEDRQSATGRAAEA
jgi:AcrR family transcriptional regulator